MEIFNLVLEILAFPIFWGIILYFNFVIWKTRDYKLALLLILIVCNRIMG
jgi:hypothetical protein